MGGAVSISRHKSTCACLMKPSGERHKKTNTIMHQHPPATYPLYSGLELRGGGGGKGIDIRADGGRRERVTLLRERLVGCLMWMEGQSSLA